MSGEYQREMTFDEWAGQVREKHSDRKDYAALRAPSTSANSAKNDVCPWCNGEGHRPTSLHGYESAICHVCDGTGTQPTDVQQLKAAIALVRQHVNVLHEAGAYALNSFLDVIEQRAAV